tara:strand:+ start:944 stop:4447 length:3504 start_codon:yes stop_codon:yes gene_type:complete
MSRLKDLNITDFGRTLPTPYIEKVYLSSGITNDYDTIEREGLQVKVTFVISEIDFKDPTSILYDAKSAFAELNVVVGLVLGDYEMLQISSEPSKFLEHLYKYKQDYTSMWEGGAAELYAESRYYPFSGYDNDPLVVPGAMNENQSRANYESLTAGPWYAYNREKYDEWLEAGGYSVVGSFQDYAPGASLKNFPGLYQNFVQISLSDADFTVSEAYYDENDNIQYYAYSATLTLPLSPETHNSSAADVTTYSELFDLMYSSTTLTYKDANVVAFTTLLDWESIATEGYGGTDLVYYYSHPKLTEKLHSNISYEKVFSNGILADGSKEVYADAENNIYQDALLDINGQYRASDPGSIVAIAESFIDVINDSSIDPSSTAYSNVESLSYLISAYRLEPDLIPRLQEYLQVFPVKSGTSKLATFYGFVNVRFNSALRVISQGAVVTPKIVRSVKIVDNRVPGTSEFLQPDVSPATADGSVNNNNRIYRPELASSPDIDAKGGVYRFVYNPSFDDMFSWEIGVCLNQGFFYFDFEKALRNDAYISSLLDFDKLETWFGREFTNSFLTLNTAEMSRRILNDTTSVSDFESYADTGNALWDEMVSFNTQYNYGDGQSYSTVVDQYGDIKTIEDNITYLMNKDYGHPNALDEYSDGTGPSGELWHGGDFTGFTYANRNEAYYSTQYAGSISVSDVAYIGVPYVILRKLWESPANTDEQNNYRMMYFEFSDPYDSTQAVDDTLTTSDSIDINYESYRINLTVDDHSYDALRHVIGVFKSALDLFYEYYEAASESCSYNTDDEGFTDSFINSMNSTYGDNLSMAPWYRCPMIFNMFKDLLTDAYGGNESKLFEEASIASDKLNPLYTDINQVETFYNTMLDFYNTFFANWESVAADESSSSAVDSNGVVTELMTPGVNNREFIYTQYIPFFNPLFYSSGTEYYDEYYEELMTTPAYGYMNAGYSGTLRSAYIISEDTYTRSDILEYFTGEFDWAEFTISSGMGAVTGLLQVYISALDNLIIQGISMASEISAMKKLLQVLMTPQGLSFEEYYDAVVGAGGYDAGTLELAWHSALTYPTGDFATTGAVAAHTGIPRTYSTLSDYLDDKAGSNVSDQSSYLTTDTSLSVVSITASIMIWAWPAACGYTFLSPTYSGAEQIADLYEFFGIDDSYKPELGV